MKAAIIVRKETADRCIGKGCMRAFYEKKDAFEEFKDCDLELIAFTHTGGDFEHKLKRLKEVGVEVLFLSTCMRAKSPNYEELLISLKKDFNVIGYTHGSKVRKVKHEIN